MYTQSGPSCPVQRGPDLDTSSRARVRCCESSACPGGTPLLWQLQRLLRLRPWPWRMLVFFERHEFVELRAVERHEFVELLAGQEAELEPELLAANEGEEEPDLREVECDPE